MQKSAQALDKGTQNLISALKSSSMRGRYGEIGLRRVVEFAAMTEHCDFVEQASTASERGALRPDVIIKLPEKKTIIVDSKTPLDAYMKAFETDNEEEQLTFLSQHATSVTVADNIEQIRDAGIELYNRTTVVLTHFSKIGGGLKSAVGNYNSAVASFESRFTPQARKLHALGSAYTKNVIPDIQPVELAISLFTGVAIASRIVCQLTQNVSFI